VVEAAKGALVLGAGLELFTLVHRDVQAIAERIVEHFHFNPASRYPRILIDAAGALNDERLVVLAMGALAYSTVRFVEAYGLWLRRRWAEWFAVVAGGLYIPIEIYELLRRVTWIRFGLLAVNLAVVVYLALVLWQTRRQEEMPRGKDR
jgi:uncharacterized membrane protein (DUF2068 family)